MWLSQVSSQWQSKATTCATTQHKSRAVPILLIFTDLIEDPEGLMSLISFQINRISSFPLSLYKYFIKQRRNPSRFGRKRMLFWTALLYYCVWSILWWIYLKFKLCDSSIACVNKALEGPLCRVCTPLLFASEWFGSLQTIWLFPVVCFNSCRIWFSYCRIS